MRLSFHHTPAVAAILVMACMAMISWQNRGSESSQTLCVDTITVSGVNLDVPMKVTVAVPSQYMEPGDTTSYPVVYLLNGHGGNYKSWGTLIPLDTVASQYGCIIVCPSGMNSWYWDSPENPGLQMESFFIDELIPYIDSNYRTIASRDGRAITGFSMGGHGALWLGWRHSDIFSSTGAMSGGVNIIPFPTRWNMANSLGAYEDNPERWQQHTVINLVDSLQPGQVNIIFDCGTEDFFYDVNCQLDSALNARKIHHTYFTRPGAHNGEYWRVSVFPHLDYFKSHWAQ